MIRYLFPYLLHSCTDTYHGRPLNDVNNLLRESYANRGDRVSASDRPLPVFNAHLLDNFPQTIRLDAGPFDKIPNPVHSTNPSEVDQLAGSTSSLSSGLEPLAPPNSRDPFVLNAPKDEIPSLFGVSSMIDDVSVASGERAPKASVVSLRGSATLPPDISPVMSELEASRSVVMETAMNPFQNTVGTSASGARPFVFDHPNHLIRVSPPLLLAL
ncbi:hypothetical protein H4Q26_012343 [Puccinia striiformis f. sp. tritici PST-130]|nr:hypothetical protein H4Q26_012343 [Puccinia striiformis f. sp. tritici PST-130]